MKKQTPQLSHARSVGRNWPPRESGHPGGISVEHRTSSSSDPSPSTKVLLTPGPIDRAGGGGAEHNEWRGGRKSGGLRVGDSSGVVWELRWPPAQMVKLVLMINTGGSGTGRRETALRAAPTLEQSGGGMGVWARSKGRQANPQPTPLLIKPWRGEHTAI